MQCISGPMAGKIGGTATSRGLISSRRKRQTGTHHPSPPRTKIPILTPPPTAPTPPFPFQLSVYLQPPFNGPADTTCPWGVVSSHRGDVWQCPAPTDIWRPPARRLGENSSTVFHAGDVTKVLNDTALEISGPNFTEIVRGANGTDLLAAAQALIPSASLADPAPSAGGVGSNGGSLGASTSGAGIDGAAAVATLTGSVAKFTPIRNLIPCTKLSC